MVVVMVVGGGDHHHGGGAVANEARLRVLVELPPSTTPRVQDDEGRSGYTTTHNRRLTSAAN